MNEEKMKRHIDHLEQIHDDLDKEIQKQILEYGNDALVTTLKKKKLHLKDEIESYKHKMMSL